MFGSRFIGKLGLKWYEGVFLGALLLMSVFSYITYQRMVAAESELAVNRRALEAARHVQELDQQQDAIDQDVVRMINRQLVVDRREQRLQREDLIREYLIFQPATAGDDSGVVADHDVPQDDPTPTATVDRVVATSPTAADDSVQPTTEASDVDRTRDKLEHLAGGLHDAYCDARPDQAGCSPE